jgi:acetolactate synthase-1/2/3 large subunit
MSGAEAFVEMLVANGVDYIFINSGSDVFLIQEAVSKFSANRKPVSRLILCPDEATAISAAHGYFMVSKNHK